MTNIHKATLVIYVSPNGRDNWVPVEPGAVPAWLRVPAIMGRLVAGEACSDPRSASGNNWFRAERVLTPDDRASLQAAQEKREMRQEKRVVH